MAAQLAFASDYMEGAHPAILKKLAETNLIKSAGYGLDEYSETDMSSLCRNHSLIGC